MNIFAVHDDPVQAAHALCDKHVVKMPLETAQLLCSPWPPGTAPYKRTHYNHPCAVWARQCSGNYRWLLDHGQALLDEYTRRYGREHASGRVVAWCRDNWRVLALPRELRTPWPQCMPEAQRGPEPVEAYRRYYLAEKARIARWERGRNAPGWWLDAQRNATLCA